MTIEVQFWHGMVIDYPISMDSFKLLDKYFTGDLNASLEFLKTNF